MSNADAIPLRVTYARTTHGARAATFDDGTCVNITVGRARAYPGLPSEAPQTIALYKLAAKLLPENSSVIDVGCGAGIGTRILADSMKRVVGVDAADEAIEFSKRIAATSTNATIERANACQALPDSTFDCAVSIDVLAHLASPLDALAAIAAQLAAGGKVFLAEPAAHPEQCLRAPARRAFTKRTLASFLSTAGFSVDSWVSEGTFLACIAHKIDDEGTRALAGALHATTVSWALSLLAEAMKSPRATVKLEAMLLRAEFLFAGGEGDAACRLWFDARELAPHDPRATLGLARVALATNNAGDAESLAVLALRADACDADAHAILARAKECLGENRERVIDSWRAAANLAPDSVVYADKLVDAAIRAGDSKRALFTAERLRAYERTNRDAACSAQIVYAKALLADGRESDARYELQIARGQSNDTAWADVTLASLRGLLGR